MTQLERALVKMCETVMSEENLNNTEVAKRMKCSRSYISQLRKGKRTISLDFLERFAKVTHRTVELHLSRRHAEIVEKAAAG
jgi:transcriptional regulator with XRE-family HTH domain